MGEGSIGSGLRRREKKMELWSELDTGGNTMQGEDEDKDNGWEQKVMRGVGGEEKRGCKGEESKGKQEVPNLETPPWGRVEGEDWEVRRHSVEGKEDMQARGVGEGP